MIPKNPSDNQKYFPDRPECFKFWGMKKEFNLALSVKIEDQNCMREIKKLQNSIKKQISGIKLIKGSEINKIEKKGFKKDALYEYSDENFHFTLINFLKYSVGFKYVSRLDPEELQRVVKNYEHYRRKRDEIQKVIEEKKPHDEVEVDLRWIYSGDKDGIDSISLQVFPPQEFIKKLEKIEEEVKDKRRIQFPWPGRGVKANPKHCKRAFAINIFRFIKNTEDRKPKLSEENKKKLIKCVEEINKKYDNKPPKKIKIKKIALFEVNDAFFCKHKEVRPFCLKKPPKRDTKIFP